MSKGYEGEVIESFQGKKIVLKSASDDCHSGCNECVFNDMNCDLGPLIGGKCLDIPKGYWQEWKADAP